MAETKDIAFADPGAAGSTSGSVAPMAAMTDADWDELLGSISEGMVVPVVGARLLLDADGVGSLQARIAAKLLAAHGVQPPPEGLPLFREVNEAVTLLKGLGKDVQRLYNPIFQAMQDLRTQGVPIPRPMEQLAQISDFRLVVTVTPDSLMTRALEGAGRAVNEVVHSPKLPTDQGSDLPADWARVGGPVQLLYLFGKARSNPLYSIHDEDMLEYAHNVIVGGNNTPRAFLGALQDRSLLLIGCNFPEWLSRFMLRATRRGRLADQRGVQGWLVEPLRTEDPVIGFLGKYSPATSVLSSITPAAFVDELHRRWMARQTPPEPDPVKVAAKPTMPASAMFFISYSRPTDLPRAVQLYDALRALGVTDNEIWFDRKDLEPGEDFRQRIVEGIRGCRYFLPLVSSAAAAREEAWVFREWALATERLEAMNRAFLVPLVVDAENHPETYQERSVQNWVDRNLNFAHAPEGRPDERGVAALTRLVRAARGAT